MTNVLKTLIDAKQLLLDKGRTHTILRDKEGCYCALGAIGASVVGDDVLDEKGYALFEKDSIHLNPDVFAATEAVVDVLEGQDLLNCPRAESKGYNHVYGFNDKINRTDAEVFALFDKAIEVEQAKLTAKEVLTSGLDLLRKDGRTRNVFVDIDGCRCALGAIGSPVVGDDRLQHYSFGLFRKDGLDAVRPLVEATEALSAALPDDYVKTAMNSYQHVYDYNDDVTTTDEDVIAWFERAIEAQAVSA